MNSTGQGIPVEEFVDLIKAAQKAIDAATPAEFDAQIKIVNQRLSDIGYEIYVKDSDVMLRNMRTGEVS